MLYLVAAVQENRRALTEKYDWGESPYFISLVFVVGYSLRSVLYYRLDIARNCGLAKRCRASGRRNNGKSINLCIKMPY